MSKELKGLLQGPQRFHPQRRGKVSGQIAHFLYYLYAKGTNLTQGGLLCNGIIELQTELYKILLLYIYIPFYSVHMESRFLDNK